MSSWWQFWRKRNKYEGWLHADVYYNPATDEYKTDGSISVRNQIILPKKSTFVDKKITTLNLPWHPTKKWEKGDISLIDTIIVHQAAGPGNIEQINHYHITGPNHLSSDGAPHICYDYGIRKNGEICKLNDFEDILWSNKGVNTRGVAILVVGNFTAEGYHAGKEKPTPQQIESLKWLVTYLCDHSELKNLSYERVFGHNYFGKPYCPGDVLDGVVKGMRNSAS